MDVVAGRTWAGERRPLRHVDWAMLTIVAVLIVAGLFLVYSATSQTLRADGLDPFARVKKQIVAVTLGFGLMFLITTFDYRFFKVYSGFAYAGVALALALVKIPWIGATDSAGVAQRYFSIAGFQITPSELAKISTLMMLAAILSELRSGEPSVQDLTRLIAVVAVPLLLVFLQPDIGTSIVLVVVAVGILVVAGTRAKHLAILSLAGSVAILLAFQTGVIQQYQRDRITAFIDRDGVSADARYNLEQALIAMGSGGVLGKGYLGGSQTNLDYVPEQHTDFIFTVVGEEFGFVGSMFVLLLFALLLWRAIRIAYLAKDPFGTYVAAGIASMFAIQLFVNIGMVIGIMPITGIPLPLLSYGGSSMLASLIALGILESIHMRRFT
jgi:rod shape determining protein RodA